MLTYHGYCNFILGLLEKRDQNFERKFHSLTLQNFLLDAFKNLFFPLIQDSENFLPKKEDGTINFQPVLQNSSNPIYLTLVDKCLLGSMTKEEAKGIIFETAMMTLKVLCKCTEGFFLNSVFKIMKPTVLTLFDKTKHLLKLHEVGADYIVLILQFMNNFGVFENNGLLTNRIKEFPNVLPNLENWMPPSHLKERIT